MRKKSIPKKYTPKFCETNRRIHTAPNTTTQQNVSTQSNAKETEAKLIASNEIADKPLRKSCSIQIIKY